MKYDVFFSISLTPAAGHTPAAVQIVRNVFLHVQAAAEGGMGGEMERRVSRMERPS